MSNSSCAPSCASHATSIPPRARSGAPPATTPGHSGATSPSSCLAAPLRSYSRYIWSHSTAGHDLAVGVRAVALGLAGEGHVGRALRPVEQELRQGVRHDACRRKRLILGVGDGRNQPAAVIDGRPTAQGSSRGRHPRISRAPAGRHRVDRHRLAPAPEQRRAARPDAAPGVQAAPDSLTRWRRRCGDRSSGARGCRSRRRRGRRPGARSPGPPAR